MGLHQQKRLRGLFCKLGSPSKVISISLKENSGGVLDHSLCMIAESGGSGFIGLVDQGCRQIAKTSFNQPQK